MRLMRVVALLVLLALLVGAVGAASVAPASEDAAATVRPEPCPAVDLTGRVLVNTIVSASEYVCVYKRPKYTAECQTNTPMGWTLVGLIDPPKNKDKVKCVYHNLAGVGE